MWIQKVKYFDNFACRNIHERKYLWLIFIDTVTLILKLMCGFNRCQ
jgi:hypothetical protein